MGDFTAIFAWDGQPIAREVLDRANACVRHRCPDGAWAWSAGSVGMAQADLATLPEDEPSVPVTSGALRIVASCRIDNRKDILGGLPVEHLPQGSTDAALILAAYETWGEACAERLVGDFAFVIWDPHRTRVFAARDPSGARQLYYHRSRDRLVLASDLNQAIQDPTLPCDVDEEQLVEFLTPSFQWYSGWDLGLLRDFSVLPAGWTLVAGPDRLKVRPFWTWCDSPPDLRPREAILEAYLHTLDEAVKCRLRSRGPVGIELSGGLDSSAIACLAARLAEGDRPEVQTYSGVFDETPEVDERVRIRAVLDRYPQLAPHLIGADDHFRLPYLEPGWNPARIVGPHEVWLSSLTPLMISHASKNGCKVVLTGQLGDGLNEGCGLAYFDLLRRRRFREILEWLGLDWARSKRRCLGRFLVHGILPLVAPGPLLRAILRTQDAWKPPTLELPGFLSSELRRRIIERDREIRKARIGRYAALCPSVRTTLLTISPPMVGVTLRHPQPVELRHPYSDRRLVEMVLGMAQACRWDIRLREGRFHHRSALDGVLPDSVRVRNFGVEFGPAIRRNASPAILREWLLEGRSVNIFDRGYVRPNSFLTELEKPIDGGSYLLPLLSIEACLRSLESAGRAKDP